MNPQLPRYLVKGMVRRRHFIAFGEESSNFYISYFSVHSRIESSVMFVSENLRV